MPLELCHFVDSLWFFTVYGKFAITCEVVAMADHLQDFSLDIWVVPVGY